MNKNMFTIGNLTYELIDDHNCTVTKCNNKNITEIAICSKVVNNNKLYNVVSVGKDTFNNSKIKKVYLDNGICFYNSSKFTILKY